MANHCCISFDSRQCGRSFLTSFLRNQALLFACLTCLFSFIKLLLHLSAQFSFFLSVYLNLSWLLIGSVLQSVFNVCIPVYEELSFEMLYLIHIGMSENKNWAFIEHWYSQSCIKISGCLDTSRLCTSKRSAPCSALSVSVCFHNKLLWGNISMKSTDLFLITWFSK